MSTAGPRPQPANWLLLVADELHAGCLGHAGHPLVPTPALDRLAACGTFFTSAYTPSPICVPARASLATGLEVHETRCWDNALAWRGAPPGWPQALAAAGRRVEAIGKLHHAGSGFPLGFTRQQRALHVDQGLGQVWGSVRDPLPASAGPSPLFEQLGEGVTEHHRFDLGVTADTCAWLQARAEAPDATPWTLFVGWIAPHFPLVVPRRWLDRIDAARIVLPARGAPRHPWVERMAGFCDHDAALGSDARRRQALHAYLALVAFVDEQVGRVLQALEDTGLAATTRVLFTADHGDNLGARGLWNKCVLYGDSTRVPLLLAGPGVAQRRCTTPVSLSDVDATVRQGAGLPPGPGAGCSLLALAAAQDAPRRTVLSQYHAVGSASGAFRLADAHWAYHHYVGHRPELFDLRADPLERDDRAAHEPARVSAWEGALRDRLEPEAVDRAAKADQAALVARVGGREAAWRLGPRGATPVPEEATR